MHWNRSFYPTEGKKCSDWPECLFKISLHAQRPETQGKQQKRNRGEQKLLPRDSRGCWPNGERRSEAEKGCVRTQQKLAQQKLDDWLQVKTQQQRKEHSSVSRRKEGKMLTYSENWVVHALVQHPPHPGGQPWASQNTENLRWTISFAPRCGWQLLFICITWPFVRLRFRGLSSSSS